MNPSTRTSATQRHNSASRFCKARKTWRQSTTFSIVNYLTATAILAFRLLFLSIATATSSSYIKGRWLLSTWIRTCAKSRGPMPSDWPRHCPFPSPTYTLDFGRNYLSYGALFFQRGYLDQAEASFQQALRDDPSSAEALYGIGSVYMNQNKNAAAREAFERCVKLPANYPDTLPDAWNNLGVIATREGRVEESIPCFLEALRLNPRHLLSLDNLGNAYRSQKRWEDARKVLERAVEVAPEDPEANYSLGMVFAQGGENDKAYEYLQRALKARPIYPEALNNLGVLYLVTQRRDQAVASFEQCIRVAPGFDQAYMNLARVYALERERSKARDILLDLLKQHPDHAQAKQALDQLQQ